MKQYKTIIIYAVSGIEQKQALESESCRKQDGARYESSSPVLTRISREELLRYAGFTSD